MGVCCTLDLVWIIHLGYGLLRLHRALSLRLLRFLFDASKDMALTFT